MPVDTDTEAMIRNLEKKTSELRSFVRSLKWNVMRTTSVHYKIPPHVLEEHLIPILETAKTNKKPIELRINYIGEEMTSYNSETKKSTTAFFDELEFKAQVDEGSFIYLPVKLRREDD